MSESRVQRNISKAEQSANQARDHLVIAKAAQESTKPGRRQEGRAEARGAKRRFAKANRRIGKLLCQLDQEGT